MGCVRGGGDPKTILLRVAGHDYFLNVANDGESKNGELMFWRLLLVAWDPSK